MDNIYSRDFDLIQLRKNIAKIASGVKLLGVNCPTVLQPYVVLKHTVNHQQQNALAGFSNGGLPPYGYLRKEVEVSDEVGNLKQKLSWELDPQTAPAVRQAFDAYFEGKGANKSPMI